MVRIDDVEAWKSGFRLHWSGDEGFGQYDLVIKSDAYNFEILGFSEHMDKGDDKDFLRSLFQSLADRVTVVE